MLIKAATKGWVIETETTVEIFTDWNSLVSFLEERLTTKTHLHDEVNNKIETILTPRKCNQ